MVRFWNIGSTYVLNLCPPGCFLVLPLFTKGGVRRKASCALLLKAWVMFLVAARRRCVILHLLPTVSSWQQSLVIALCSLGGVALISPRKCFPSCLFRQLISWPV